MMMMSNDTSMDFSGSESPALFPTCSKGFYLDDGVNGTFTCRPACGEFLAKTFTRQFFENAAVCVSIIASISVFIIAATVQRDSLLVFPSIILVYVCISSIIMSSTFFVGFLDNYGLYCGQRDYLFLLGKGNETPYTRFSGMVFVYFLIQLDVWTSLHCIFLFWCIRFPFSYRRLKISRKMHHAHIASVLLALLLPLPGPFVLLRDGYIITDHPNLISSGRNPDHYFYFFTLPACLLLAVINIMLILIFWTILKELVIKKIQNNRKMQPMRVGKAQLKILMVIIYFSIFAVMGLGSYAYFTQNTGYLNSIFAYIGCESSGFAPIDCFAEVLDTRSRDIVGYLLSISTCTLVLWPVVVIVFTINFKVWPSRIKFAATVSRSSTNTTGPEPATSSQGNSNQ